MVLTDEQFNQVVENFGIRYNGYYWIPKEFGNVNGVCKDTLHAIFSMVEHHQQVKGPLLTEALNRVDELIAERDALLDEIDSLKSDV